MLTATLEDVHHDSRLLSCSSATLSVVITRGALRVIFQQSVDVLNLIASVVWLWELGVAGGTLTDLKHLRNINPVEETFRQELQGQGLCQHSLKTDLQLYTKLSISGVKPEKTVRILLLGLGFPLLRHCTNTHDFKGERFTSAHGFSPWLAGSEAKTGHQRGGEAAHLMAARKPGEKEG